MGNYKANKNNVPKPSVAEKVIDFFKVCFESKEGVGILVLLINLVVLLVVLVLSFIDSKPKAEVTKIVEETTVIEDAPIVKDSIDMVVDKRAEQDFNSTIFAGLRFGSNRQAVEKALKNQDNKTIHVFDGDDVKKVIIRDYDAIYYNGKLASLTLYSDEARLLKPLGLLYSTKYGETKNNKWVFSNCEIIIEQGTRSLYSSAKDSGLASAQDMYYDSYRFNSGTKRLTANPFFLRIEYKSLPLLRSLDYQKALKDSLERERIRKEAEREKEKERKLATEEASNI